MTALCGGGTSQPKSTTPLVVNITISAALAWLSRYYAAANWLSNIVGFLPFPDLTMSSFCASDPPAIPTFDATDALNVASALAGGGVGLGVTATKITDLVQHLAWLELCECTSGAVPTYPTAPAPPAGAVSPPPVGGSTVGACGSLHNGPVASPTGAIVNWLGGGAYALPQGTTSMRLTVNHVSVGTRGHQNLGENLYLYDVYGASLNVNAVFRSAPLGTSVYVIDRDPRVFFVAPTHSYPGAATDDTLEGTWEFFCGGVPATGVQLPCCPPDTVATGLLEQLLTLVTLMQRQSVPFAYVPGALHTGLSGNGELAVQGLIGAKITAAVPGRAGLDLGNPDTVYDIGWINWGNADGFIPREKLVTSPQLSFPSLAGNYTRLGYSIPSDVTISIRELVREP